MGLGVEGEGHWLEVLENAQFLQVSCQAWEWRWDRKPEGCRGDSCCRARGAEKTTTGWADGGQALGGWFGGSERESPPRG